MQRHLLHLQYLRLPQRTYLPLLYRMHLRQRAVHPHQMFQQKAHRQRRLQEESSASELEDGTYTADFNTDSNMFHVNEAKEGKGVLTVKDGKMTIHVSLVSKNIVNVFVGTKEEAQADGAELIEPTTDEVTYSDGTTDEVYGFDIPVEKLDENFNVAIIGKKGTWYDHVVSVSNPVPQE